METEFGDRLGDRFGDRFGDRGRLGDRFGDRGRLGDRGRFFVSKPSPVSKLPCLPCPLLETTQKRLSRRSGLNEIISCRVLTY